MIVAIMRTGSMIWGLSSLLHRRIMSLMNRIRHNSPSPIRCLRAFHILFFAYLLFRCYCYNHYKTPKIFVLLSLFDLTFASGHEGIDNPFIALVARFLIVCAGIRWLVCRLLLDWYLGSQNWGKYLCYFAAEPFPFQGKIHHRLKR